jgi:hypothetical protein
MSDWKEEDIAKEEYIRDYLEQFRNDILCNTEMELKTDEKQKVEASLEATEQFCVSMVNRRDKKLYMHDLILMAIGYYGGYLSAIDR